jgi:NAD(P)H-quinone oxidoreductase subunit 5
LYFDSIAGLMLIMVSFVGVVVCAYSVRYLDGESTQGRYYRWIALTLGAVTLMVVAGNLLLFFLAWVTTSFGLHRLLLHYPHRPAAQRAAWTKFGISRLGDLFLLLALALTWTNFGTWELTELFATLGASSEGGAPPAQAWTAIAWLLMLGAVTKSAQFPFHTWLPETMETPTPVSALMHAGIVNAGGYLVIRMSPVVTQAPTALATLAVIGTVTACFAGVVMLTQNSVKRSLAYSTIAQMGFMMIQCGLGAFSAAMLHILAHSLYKAHAFLSSGSVLQQAQASGQVTAKPTGRSPWQLGQATLLAFVLAMVSAGYVAMSFAVGLDLAAKPGGFVLGFVLCLALATWVLRTMHADKPAVVLAGWTTVLVLGLAYLVSYLAIDSLVMASLPAMVLPAPAFLAIALIAVAFTALVVLQMTLIRNDRRPNWLAAFHVHASNAFYIDAITRRIFPLARSGNGSA